MKNILLVSFMTLSLAGAASGAGFYDAIYKHPTDPNGYLSVHQNGRNVILTNYTTISSSNVTFYSSIGNYIPSRMDVWDLYTGTISGNTAFVTGQAIYGACLLQMNFVFDSNGATANLLSASNTEAGNSQGMRCSDIPYYGPTVQRFVRVF